MVHVNVFKQCLKKLGRWDPRLVPEMAVEPALLEAPPTLFVGNRSQTEVIGKSSPLKTTMGIKDEMYVSHVKKPTKDGDQIILVREFMMK